MDTPSLVRDPIFLLFTLAEKFFLLNFPLHTGVYGVLSISGTVRLVVPRGASVVSTFGCLIRVITWTLLSCGTHFSLTGQNHVRQTVESTFRVAQFSCVFSLHSVIFIVLDLLLCLVGDTSGVFVLALHSSPRAKASVVTSLRGVKGRRLEGSGVRSAGKEERPPSGKRRGPIERVDPRLRIGGLGWKGIYGERAQTRTRVNRKNLVVYLDQFRRDINLFLLLSGRDWEKER